MKIAFKIPPHTHDYSSLHLLAEAGGDEVSFLIFEKSPFTVHGFYTFNFDKDLNVEELTDRITEIVESEDIFSKYFAGKHLFYNFKDITLMPSDYFLPSEKENICNTMFGADKRMVCFDEHIGNSGVKVLYRIPKQIHEILSNKFSTLGGGHAVAQIKNTGSGNLLDCVVYHSTIKVILYKQDKLQIVQYFDYTTPADVVFHLLNVCKQFGVPADGVNLVVSGMIAESSGLYSEIYKYFLNISLKALPENVVLEEKLEQHPHHFYSHLIELAQCV